MNAKYPISGASDHGVSEAIYLEDPDGNGIELYWDKPKELWPKNPMVRLRCLQNILIWKIYFLNWIIKNNNQN